MFEQIVRVYTFRYTPHCTNPFSRRMHLVIRLCIAPRPVVMSTCRGLSSLIGDVVRRSFGLSTMLITMELMLLRLMRGAAFWLCSTQIQAVKAFSIFGMCFLFCLSPACSRVVSHQLTCFILNQTSAYGCKQTRISIIATYTANTEAANTTLTQTGP